MPERLRGYLELANQFVKPDGRRFAVIEGNEACNRACTYCAVPQHYNAETELTVDQTRQTVDWLYGQGYRMLSYLGGEPLVPFRTSEGITFARHTLEVVKHAKSKGMLVNVTSNGDYVRPDKPELMEALRSAGLDSLTLSLHTYTQAGLSHLLDAARLAGRHRIIPTIQTVMTSQTADKLPAIAAQAAQAGALFSVGLVQTQGDGFSTKQEDSIIPFVEQQKRVFQALSVLKRHGFVRNNMNYLRDAPEYYPNNWVCDAERDTFIKIGVGGKVNICSSVETGIRIEDITTLDDNEWRERKQVGVSSCDGCMFHCYYEAQNPDILGDIPMIGVGLAIKSGAHSLVERWGQKAVASTMKSNRDVNWNIETQL